MKSSELHEEQMAEFTRQLVDIPLFSSLDESELQQVLGRMQLINVSKGERIVVEGDTSKAFYVMLWGEASITLRMGEREEELEVGLVLPSDTMGELGMLLGSARSATVRATKTSQLLRLEREAFEDLLSKIPRFGLAVGQELARRLKESYKEKVELQVEVEGEALEVKVPEESKMRAQMSEYYGTVLKYVSSKHQLVQEARFPRYYSTFRFSEETRKRWFELFEIKGKEERALLSYYTSSKTLALMKMADDIGVHVSHLSPLKSELSFHNEGRPLEPDVEYELSYQIVDLLRVSDERVVLVIQTKVTLEKEVIASVKDFFMILNIEPAYVEALKENAHYGHHDPQQFQGLSKRSPRLLSFTEGGRLFSKTLSISKELGLQYGHLTGEMNLIHTNALAAGLFGHAKPVIQESYIVNLALRYLCSEFDQPYDEVNLTFCHPVEVGTSLQFHFSSSKFEIVGKNKLFAFGDFQRR